MPVIVITGFAGEQPRIAPRLLPPSGAQQAYNARLSDGALSAIRAQVQAGLAGAVGHQTIYKHGSTWLSWASGSVKLTTGPVDQERLYYTGDGAPKMRLLDGTVYPLAVPRPTTAPTVTLSGTATGTDVISRLYVYTFVTAFGEESEPCPVPVAVDWQAGRTVTISGIEAAPGGRNITKQRFYRTQTGSAGTYLYLIAERSAGNSNFVDTAAPDVFQEPLPSASWNTPPSGLSGLISMPNGMMAAFVGRDLYFCEPFIPHAWPEKYVLTTDSNIVALAAIGGTLVVMTEAQPYVVTGSHPSSMQMVQTEINLPCINARGVADLGSMVIYPSIEGLVAIRGDGASGIVSANLFQRDEWLDLNPYTMIGCQFGAFYIGFYVNTDAMGKTYYGAVIIDVSGQSATLSRQAVRADAAWFDPKTGGTYILPYNSTGINQIDTPYAPRLTYSWKSKPFTHKEPVNYGVILIESEVSLSGADRTQYDALSAAAVARNAVKIATGKIKGALRTVRLGSQRLAGDSLERPQRSGFTGSDGYSKAEAVVYANGRAVISIDKTNKPVRLPSGFKAETWEVQLSGNVRIDRVTMATTMNDLQQSPPG